MSPRVLVTSDIPSRLPALVGIGTAATADALTVAGKLTVTGGIFASTTCAAPTVNATAAYQANGAPGQSVVVPVAKITVGGVNGSLTFTQGILTTSVAPT